MAGLVGEMVVRKMTLRDEELPSETFYGTVSFLCPPVGEEAQQSAVLQMICFVGPKRSQNVKQHILAQVGGPHPCPKASSLCNPVGTLLYLGTRLSL